MEINICSGKKQSCYKEKKRSVEFSGVFRVKVGLHVELFSDDSIALVQKTQWGGWSKNNQKES